MAVETRDRLLRIAMQWSEMKRTDTARRGEDTDPLRLLETSAKVALLYEALQLLEEIDEQHGCTIGMLEKHVEGGHALTTGYVICQSDGGSNAGGFPKWSKVMEGSAPVNDDARQAWCVFADWKDAKCVLDHFDEPIRVCNRIYPVVAIAGNEPRTTNPRGDQ